MSKLDVSWLIGQKVTEINPLNPCLVFDIGSIIIECPWRIRDNKSILLGYSEYRALQEEKDFRGRLQELLLNKSICDYEFTPETSDLRIMFEGGLMLELFHDSSYFEGWQLHGPNGFLLVSLPGGEYSICED